MCDKQTESYLALDATNIPHRLYLTGLSLGVWIPCQSAAICMDQSRYWSVL